MRIYKNIIIFFFCIACSICNAQTIIAVLDFQANGISEPEAILLTDRFRVELVSTWQYTVIERGQMEELLKEQGFQQSGCTTPECAVEVGNLLGAEQIIGGTIGKIGNVFTVSVRMIEISSGEIVNVTAYDHIGDIGGLLTTGMRNTVQQLFEMKNNKPTLVQTDTVTDIDGNVYATVKIGNQVWMAENLEVTHYRNGDTIPNLLPDLSDLGEWADFIGSDFRNYGLLYDWYMVTDSRNIAPKGWHVPSDAEWQTLIDHLGGKRTAGGRMKDTGTEHWESPNTGATNESRFMGLPAGYVIEGGWPGGEGHYAYFWSSTESGSDKALTRVLAYNYSSIARESSSQTTRLSVRCIKD